MQVISTLLAEVACHCQQESLSISCPYKSSMIWESYKKPFLLVSSLTLQNEIFTLVVKSLLEKEYMTPSPVKRMDNTVTVIVVNSRNRSDRQMGFAPGNSLLSTLELLLSVQQECKAQCRKHSCACMA